MRTYQPQPAVLDPIETASTDELRALQQTRLRDTLRHAYDNIDHHRTAFDAVGLHPCCPTRWMPTTASLRMRMSGRRKAPPWVWWAVLSSAGCRRCRRGVVVIRR